MEMHVLAVEYPGYGLYKTSPPSEQQIKEDAEIVYDYLTKNIGLNESDIILFGRSMGSGPATHLASKRNANSLLLMSAYTSIKDVARSLLGKLSFLLTPIVYERFRNVDAIKDAKCPVFFLHGSQDKLIPHTHSIELRQNCPTLSYLHSPAFMDHNEFDFIDDLVKPFKEFLQRISNEKHFEDEEFKDDENFNLKN
jgi:pimeloyl-ACP methyl ester carboxylesterase